MNSLLASGQTILSGLAQNPLRNSAGQPYNAYSYCYALDQAAGSVTLANTGAVGYDVVATFPPPSGLQVRAFQGNAGPYVGVTPSGNYLCLTDCSGFVGYVVMTSAPAAYQQLCAAWGGNFSHAQPWPSASEYAQLYQRTGANLSAWTIVATDLTPAANLATTQPDDIFAYAISGGSDTGHVMLLTAPIEPANGVYSLQVMDESEIPHANDSGRSPAPYFGLGTGMIAMKGGPGAWQGCLDPKAKTPFWFPMTAFSVLRAAQ